MDRETERGDQRWGLLVSVTAGAGECDGGSVS